MQCSDLLGVGKKTINIDTLFCVVREAMLMQALFRVILSNTGQATSSKETGQIDVTG
jgi:hypothetical protein